MIQTAADRFNRNTKIIGRNRCKSVTCAVISKRTIISDGLLYLFKTSRNGFL